MNSFLAQQMHLGRPRAERADPGLEIALRAAGSVTRLADLLGLSHATVSLWREIPKRHVPTIAAGLGIPPHEQRPDAFPIPPRRRRGLRAPGPPSPWGLPS